MKLKTIKNLNLKNKKILMRVDFNVPIKNGRILDLARLRAGLPTLRYLLKKRARIILISHLGDPGGRRIKKLSLKPISLKLAKLLQMRIKFLNDCLGDKIKKEINRMGPEEIILLENLRFYPGEEKNDLRFAEELAELGDVYINEAFSVCHRQHASVAAITKFLPSYAGFLLEKEVQNLSAVLHQPKHPLIVVMGGVKISTKIEVIQNLAKKADKILIGGALANNFFVAKGLEIGDSIYEKEMVSMAKKLLKNKKLVLPIDVKIELRKRPSLLHLNNEAWPPRSFKILDIGPETSKLFSKYLKSAKMIIWNGPMGYAEDKRFASGTREIIRAIFNNRKAKVVIGGGETIAALRQTRTNTDWIRTDTDSQCESVLSRCKSVRVFVSTGGGAMLKFFKGKPLPGIKSLIK